MKPFLIYLMALMLPGSIKAIAQNDCPDIEWMRFLNDSGDISYVDAPIIDSNKDMVVTVGYTGNFSINNTNLPVPPNLLGNGFIAKTDSAGNTLWFKVAESLNSGARVSTISTAAGVDGAIYTAVNFIYEIKFDGATYTTSPQQENALLVKMDAQGQIQWTHVFEGVPLAIRYVDNDMSLYFVTDFTDTLSIDGQTFISNGGSDILVFKLDQQLQLVWTQQIGGSKDEYNFYNNGFKAFKVDAQNNVYVAGNFASPILTLGNTQLTNQVTSANIGSNVPDIFIAKIDSSGQYEWAVNTSIDTGSLGTSYCHVTAIEADDSANVYISGSLTGTFNLNNNPVTSVGANSFLIQYDPVTAQFSPLLFKGGQSISEGLLYLPDKNMMPLGGTIYDQGQGAVDFYIDSIVPNGDKDFYLLGVLTDEEKLEPQWLMHSGGAGSEIFQFIAKDHENGVYISGYYGGDGQLGNYTFPPTNAANAWMAKLGFLSREVTVDSNVLIAVQDSAMYQWLDCNNGMEPIAGADSQGFTPAQPGSYAVRVSNSFCSVLSDCMSTTGIPDRPLLSQISVYPNPVNRQVTISHLPLGTNIAVYDILGRTLYSHSATGTTTQIATDRWSPGLYMIALSKAGIKYYVKVVKE